MKVTVIPSFDLSEETGSDADYDWLKEAEEHPDIKPHKPFSPYGGSYLTRLNESGLCCWCTPTRGGFWNWSPPYFRVQI